MSLVAPRQCLLCKCTDERACEEGCSWEFADPWVCSSCATEYLIATMWHVLMGLEGVAKGSTRMIAPLREFYESAAKNNPAFPRLRRVRAIQRAEMKWARATRQAGSMNRQGAKSAKEKR